MSQERRKRPRCDVGVPARLTVAGRALDVHLHDICRDAALVEGDTLFGLGTAVSLSLALPGLTTHIEVAGRVIRTATGALHPHAMAVLFDEVSPGDAARIDFFVALYDARAATG